MILIVALQTFSALALAHADAPPPGVLTLEQALNEAHGKSPELQAARAAAEQASWKPLDALSANLPKIAVSGNHFFDLKYQVLHLEFNGIPTSFPAIYPYSLLSVGAQWTVFDGLSTPYLYRAARLEADAARLEADRAALKIDNEVRFKFYRALAAQGLDEVAAQNVKTLQDHYDKAQSLLKQGEATQFDLLRIQVKLEEAMPEKSTADDNVTLSRMSLAETIGAETAGTAKDDRPLYGQLPIPDAAQEQWAKNAGPLDLQERQDVQAMLKRADAADNTRLSTYGAWIPHVALTAEQQWYNNSTSSLSDTANYHTAYSLGFLMSWNIFDAGLIARNRENAHAQERQDALARQAVLHAPFESELARHRLLEGVELFRARSRAVEAARESLRLAKIGLGAGSRTSTDVLDAELDLFRALEGRVRAQLDTAEAQMNLELALGRRFQP